MKVNDRPIQQINASEKMLASFSSVLRGRFRATPTETGHMHDSLLGPADWWRESGAKYAVAWNRQRFLLQLELEQRQGKLPARRLTIFSRRTGPNTSAPLNTSRLTFRSTNSNTSGEFFVRPTFLQRQQHLRDRLCNFFGDSHQRPFASGSKIFLASEDYEVLIKSFLLVLSIVEDLKASPPLKVSPAFLKTRYPGPRRNGPDAKLAVRRDKMTLGERMRKYGPGGEGKMHARLKQYIACHPEVLGVGGMASEAVIEHRFDSGNHVDVLIQFTDGRDAVVEVETDVPLPGCHQAVMYRVLRCVQRNADLGSPEVVSALVAFKLDPRTRELANKYGVHVVTANRDWIS